MIYLLKKPQEHQFVLKNIFLTFELVDPYFVSIKSFNNPTDFHAESFKGATHFFRLLSSSFDELSHSVARSINGDDFDVSTVVIFACIVTWIDS